MRSNTFDRLSFLSLFLVIILLPFFFLPFTNIPVGISKGALLVIGLAFSVIFWGFARFFDGKIILPKSMFLAAGGGIVLVFFLSALLVKASQVSFFGTMLDVGTFWFMFAGFLLMLMCSISFRHPKSARLVLFGAILSAAIVLIFQAIRLLAPQILSLGVLASKTDNLIGSWNELGIFAGFSAIMSLLVVEFFSTTRMEKLILQSLIVLSMILIAAVNFAFVWGLLGLSALIIFVYKISISSSRKFAQESKVEENGEKHIHISGEGEEKNYFPVFSFAIVMISLLFFMSGQSIGSILPNRLGIQNNEVGPSFQATVEVAKSVLKDNLIFGIGPNKFGEAWTMYKPKAVNSTAFWNVSFDTGSGLLPTLVATTGYASILAWLVFFVFFMISGVKSIFSSIKHGINWETMAFFLLSLYLFISSFFYSTGSVIFLLALAFAGVFAGLSATNNKEGEISIAFLSDHRKSFFSMMFLVVLVILSVAVSFKYVERFVSVSYFRKALAAETVPEAITSISKALSLYTNDLYLRAYSDVYLLKLNSLVSKGDSLSEAEKTDLQTSLDQAVLGDQQAIVYNPKNYLNFRALGSLYQNLASYGVKDAYARAVEAYQAASTLNPNNPGLKLSMAISSIADKKIDSAKEYTNAALVLKPDYIDAWIVLAEIAKSEGDTKNALEYAETALYLAPTNEDLKKYVNSFKNSNSSSVTAPSNITPPDTSKTPDGPIKKK